MATSLERAAHSVDHMFLCILTVISIVIILFFVFFFFFFLGGGGGAIWVMIAPVPGHCIVNTCTICVAKTKALISGAV